MINDILVMRQELEALKNTVARMVQVGTVEELDAAKGYRLNLGPGPDGKPVLSPWLPHPETGKTSIPLKKNQIAMAINPGGDPRQGFLLRGGYSDEHKTPSDDLEANVFEDAGVRISIKDRALVIKAGGVTITISGAGMKIEGGKVTHDGKNIGSTHIHGGVRKGVEDTAVPSN
ncbi:baseplate assembly protein [Rhizobium sp. FKY42]|uniref:baseplate assembly protein n=1 Tax=Rhizobium sp. FKY42 TaxID=2562310 RepID=UPI0010BF7003|nr:baseplate assembly protein [Rhizobium sp. FKY42]